MIDLENFQNIINNVFFIFLSKIINHFYIYITSRLTYDVFGFRNSQIIYKKKTSQFI
jgi:hypothetical protein